MQTRTILYMGQTICCIVDGSYVPGMRKHDLFVRIRKHIFKRWCKERILKCNSFIYIEPFLEFHNPYIKEYYTQTPSKLCNKLGNKNTLFSQLITQSQSIRPLSRLARSWKENNFTCFLYPLYSYINSILDQFIRLIPAFCSVHDRPTTKKPSSCLSGDEWESEKNTSQRVIFVQSFFFCVRICWRVPHRVLHFGNGGCVVSVDRAKKKRHRTRSYSPAAQSVIRS